MTFTHAAGAAGLAVTDYAQLIVQPLIRESAAFQVSTLLRTTAATYSLPTLDADPAVAWTAPGADITPTDPDTSPTVVSLAKCAVLTKIPREVVLGSQPDAATVVGQAMTRSLRSAVDAAWLDATPNANAPTGGIADAVTLDTTEVSTNLDSVAEAAATLHDNGFPAAYIVTSATQWQEWQVIKAGTALNGYVLNAQPTEAGARSVFGLPVVLAAATWPAGPKAYVVGQGASFVVLGEDVDVQVDQSRYFDSDSLAVRGTIRLGFATDARGVIGISAT